MTSSPPWDLYRSFLAVMRNGTLTAAAARLGMSQPSLGRHVDALEAALGMALFTRSRHGLTPTAQALELLPHAEAMAAAAEALARAASGETEGTTGSVRLSASEIMGLEALPPMLASFRRRHPGVTLELSLTNRVEDLLRRDADIAIRHLRPRQEALVARRIGEVAIGLFAHRSYVALHGAPESQEELLSHALIGWDREVGVAAEAIADFPLGHEDFRIRCDSHPGQLAALRAGLGIGACQIPIAARDPDLLPVLADRFRLPLEIWLCVHEDLRASRRIRLLMDHLAEGLSAYVAR
ncbi:LysR family transcriptional regulator [Methylocystis heyeri]|uniref:LysR family transcriptional regulator n=1 Tax=Methylocystis heyeri TaxID=391905 RepID=A0A6B8KE00_9HYPH|nr:LysR family transcriptional regulator [Methylocystis heyeri]QGM44650.1 LysR family transcriptional regulator [Methylocystis heyeri]